MIAKLLRSLWDWLRGRPREPELPSPTLADLEWDVGGVRDDGPPSPPNGKR